MNKDQDAGLFKRRSLLPSLALFALFWQLYRTMAAPGLDWADAAESQLAAWTAGLSHPTGYPLFLMAGWLWTHLLALFGVPPTRGMTLFSVTMGAAAVAAMVPMMEALLQRARVQMGERGRQAVAVAAAAFFGLSYTFWSQALLAEVYTLHALFLVLLLWLLWSEEWGVRRLYGVGLLLGLALSHHRTIILWLPGVLLWLERERLLGILRARRLAGMAALVLLPQLAYLYIAWRGPLVPYLHQPLGKGQMLNLYDGSLRAFLDHVLGTVFAADLGLKQSLVDRLATIGELARLNGGALFFLPLVALLLVLGLGWLALHRSDFLLLVSGAALTALFGLFYAIGDVEVMYIPAWLALTVLGFGGLAWLLARPAWNSPLGWLGQALLLLGLVGSQLSATPPSRASLGNPREILEPAVASLPPNSILVTNDRDEAVPLWYMQFAEGQRQDLLGLFPLVTDDPAHRSVDRLVGWALQWERPLFLMKEMPSLSLQYELEPNEQGLVRVTGRAPIPEGPVLQGELAPELLVTGWEPSTLRPMPGDTVTVNVAVQLAAPPQEEITFSLQLFREDGVGILQQELPPDPFFPPSRWPVGTPLRLQFHTVIPPDARPALYEWRLSAYHLQGGTLSPVGQQLLVGRSLVGAAPPPVELAEVEEPVARFERGIILASATSTSERLLAGGELVLDLHWLANGAPRRPYILFIHLLDERGQIVAQLDAPPQPPTDTWVRGDSWSDRRHLSLPPDLPPGRYTVRVGLYDEKGRLPVQGGGDAVDLFPVQVQR